MKKTLQQLAIIMALSSILVTPNIALAYDIINTTATTELEDGTGSQDIILKFGAVIAETLHWDVANDWFEFSDDVNITGGLDVDGTITAGSSARVLTNAAGDIDGEYIQDDTIDDDSLDLGTGETQINAADIGFLTGHTYAGSATNVMDALEELEGAAGASSLDGAYNGGNTIDVDGDAVTMTVSNSDNNPVLNLTQNDSTNNPDALDIVNAGSGNAIDLSGAGTRSINSTSGDMTVKTTTAGDLYLTSASQILNTAADNTANAFVVQEGSNGYITIDTTNSSELITFGQNVLMSTDKALRFRDSALTINSSADGQLDIDADTEVEVATTTLDINATTTDISGALNIGGTTTVAGANEINLRDSALKVYSSADGQLDVDADTEVEITAPTVDLNGLLDVSGTINGTTLSTTALDFNGNATVGTNDDTLAISTSSWDIASNGTATGLTIDGDDNTLQDIAWSSISTRSKKLGLVPEIPGAVYSADGDTNIGELTADYDSTGKQNYYKWISSEASLQDYDLVIGFPLPLDFSAWDTNPINIAYKTTLTTITDNQIDVSMTDTADTAATLGSNTDLKSAVANTWTASNITITGGTWTAGSYAYLTLKPQAKDGNSVYIGEITLSYVGK